MEETIISLRHISKEFSGVRVLEDVNLDLRRGEVHALVGENGAGKSTLMKILIGLYDRSGGEIAIDGKTFPHYDIATARENGISIIPQELALASALSVGENIMLGRKKGKKGFVSLKNVERDSLEYIREAGLRVHPSTRVDRLPLSQRSLVSIAKACADNAKVIIMDEPTSSLSKEEVDELMGVIRRLREKGTTIIYISHLLDEIFRITDRITVLRDGRHIVTVDTAAITQRELISHMVGEDLLRTQEALRAEGAAAPAHQPGEAPLLHLAGLCRRGGKPISLSICPGEVVGVTGLVGAGKTELLRSIVGLEKLEAGEIFVDGKKAAIRTPADAYALGIAIVPEDRKLEGLVLCRSNMENMSMTQVYRKRISKWGFLSKKQERRDALAWAQRLGTKIAGLSQRVYKLSGGNQQKIVISKALLSGPRVLLMDEPTRGIDVGAKAAIYQLIRELRQQGMAVLYLSSDVSEMPFVSDRVLVMRDGRIVSELSREEATLENMLNSMAGGES